MSAGLTSEQIKFLEECTLEFVDRFTDSDVEYKKIYDRGIPPPPIMCPWYGKSRFINNRYQAGASRNFDNRFRDDERYNNQDNKRFRRY